MIHEHTLLLNMVREQIIKEALHQLQKQTGIASKEVLLAVEAGNGKLPTVSGIRLKAGKEAIEFAVEVKSELRQHHLAGLLEGVAGRKKDPWLVLSQYIPKPLKEELRTLGINYLEASGNCFIRQGSFYVYINDQAVTPPRLAEGGKLWKPSGLKFLFIVLQYPELLNAPYRTLAKASGIALGNIGAFMEALRKEGYLKSDSEDRLFIENRESLQQRWVELFTSVLRPKLRLGTFRFSGTEGIPPDWEKLPTTHFLWGGEIAGALLTGYLRPGSATLYTDLPGLQLMKRLKLVPDENGPVELMQLFWNEEEGKQAGHAPRTVPPLLAYAELATSLDSRNWETAEKIKARYLAHGQ